MIEIEVELESLLNDSSWRVNAIGLAAFSSFFHMGCIAYTLQLVLKDGLETIEVVINLPVDFN